MHHHTNGDLYEGFSNAQSGPHQTFGSQASTWPLMMLESSRVSKPGQYAGKIRQVSEAINVVQPSDVQEVPLPTRLDSCWF